jgi:hypothetical protein
MSRLARTLFKAYGPCFYRPSRVSPLTESIGAVCTVLVGVLQEIIACRLFRLCANLFRLCANSSESCSGRGIEEHWRMPGRRAAAQTGDAAACASGLGSSAQSMAAAALLVAPCALLFVAKLQEPYMDEIFHIPQVPLSCHYSISTRLMPMGIPN